MTQYIRYCSVTAEGAGGTIDLSELRCRFTIRQAPQPSPGTLELKVTNLTALKAKRFVQKEFQKIKIDGGYQDGHGILFQGNIVQGIYGRESPTDTLLTVYAADGDHGHNHAVVNTTLPPGSTPQQHVDAALGAMAPYGITKGFIGVDLSTPVYPRAVTLWGMARDVLTRVASMKNATFDYGNEKANIVPVGGSTGGGTTVLNSKTGMIGMPTQTTEGIFARCLINPAIQPHCQVYIDQKDVQGGAAAMNVAGDTTLGEAQLQEIAADGLYVVKKIDVFGDTRGNPWYMDLGMLALNPKTPRGPTPLNLYF